MREITNKELENIVLKQPSAFLCGNGFSINFDNDFANIYDRLYEAHKLLLYSGKYDVKANNLFKKVFKDNYKNVCKYVYTYEQKDLEKVFLSGIDFAESVIKNDYLIKKLNEMGYIHKLVFGKSELDLVESIARVGKKGGYKFVNIEYWPILIYMFFAINEIDCEKYAFPPNNEFIYLIKVGYINKNKIVTKTDDIHQFALSNGFNTYYRMLFSAAVLINGKAVKFSKLSNLSNLKLDKIKNFLDNFKILLTLNYDHILENISTRPVQHIHGQYVFNEKEYVYYQSLGVELDFETYVSFSDILIGDYFTNKTFAGLVNVMNKNPVNKRIANLVKIVGNCMEKDKVEVVVIFGMNIDNDQHIIRDIMLRFSDMSLKNVKIIYCYFTEEDRNTFNEQYESSITFRKDISYRVQETELLYIKTQDILDEYFVK